MRIAAVGDVHCRAGAPDAAEEFLLPLQDLADVLVLAGDLTDTGLTSEAEALCAILKKIRIPIVGVVGNHDHESGRIQEIIQILSEAMCLLDGTVHEIGEVGFVGTKGFAGGFGTTLVQPFGEEALKTFIRAGIDEAVALENALTKLQSCKHKLAVLHYSPVPETLHGEPAELFPFLGNQRLANAIDRQGADAIVHGHAHHGSPNGKTAGNIPVYNVSRFVLQQHTGTPYCLIDF